MRSININEVIRAVIRAYFFLQKDFARTKGTEKHQKHKKHKKYKKHKNATMQKYKTLQVNKNKKCA